MSTVKFKSRPKKTNACETEAFAQFMLSTGNAEAMIPRCIKRAQKMWRLKTWADLSFQRVFELCYLETLTPMACDYSNERIDAITAMVVIFDGLTQTHSIKVYATPRQEELFGIVARNDGKYIGGSTEKEVRAYTIFHFPPSVNVKEVVKVLVAAGFEVVPMAETPDQLNPNNTLASRQSDDKLDACGSASRAAESQHAVAKVQRPIV